MASTDLYYKWMLIPTKASVCRELLPLLGIKPDYPNPAVQMLLFFTNLLLISHGIVYHVFYCTVSTLVNWPRTS